MKDKKLYYLDTVNFGIRSQKEDGTDIEVKDER